MTFKSGLNPVNKIGVADGGQLNVYRVKNGTNSQAFYAGMPVRVSTNGFLQVATNTADVLGATVAFGWINPTTERPERTEYLPAGSSTAGGSIDGINLTVLNGIAAYVIDDPNQKYVIQANTSIPVTAIGQLAQVSGATGGSSFTKRSTARLDYSAAGTSVTNAMFRITGVPRFEYQVGYGVSAGQTSEGPLTNDWDVANTFVEVVLVKPLLARA